MKTVAQTVIEADHFYTIAAHTGNVIQAVEASKDGGTVRLGKYDHDKGKGELCRRRSLCAKGDAHVR